MSILCFLLPPFALVALVIVDKDSIPSIKDYQSLSNVAAENNLKSLKS